MIEQSRVQRTAAAMTLLGIGMASMAGCSANSTILRRTPMLGDTSVLATSADVRLVTATPVVTDDLGFVKPTQINCSEPSPDVAKIVSQAFGSSGVFNFKGKMPKVPSDADLKTTMALSKSYAEGIAQMTERLASIQLLRDGLYRACEAYQNGAISATTYAAVVSRYDKTMITLLMGDLAAGNFGRSLAALGGTSSGESSAEQTYNELHEREQHLVQSLDTERTRNTTLRDQLNATPKTDDTAEQQATLKEDIRQSDDKIKQANDDLRKTKDQIDQSQKASAKSSASVQFAAAGGIEHPAGAAAAISANLVQLQANYLNDHNVDALKIACLSALGRSSSGDTSRAASDLVPFCRKLLSDLEADAKINSNAAIRQGKMPTSAVEQLFVPDPHAAGPFFNPNEAAAIKKDCPRGACPPSPKPVPVPLP